MAYHALQAPEVKALSSGSSKLALLFRGGESVMLPLLNSGIS